jgi:hypothetical protein
MLGKRIQSLLTTIVLTGGMAAAAAAILPGRAQAQDPAQNTGESVADAARKSRENKKNAPKGTKVYTDDEVSPTPAPGASAQAAAPAADGSAPASGDAPAASGNGTAGASDPKNPQGSAGTTDKADEKAWRKRFQAQRDKIAFAEKELDVLQREQDKAQVQYYPDPQKALSEGYTRKDINEKDVKIAAKKDEIAKLKQGLDDMEDELRKSGGDPGWAR